MAQACTDVTKILAEVAVFQGLAESQLADIAHSCQVRTLDKGMFVFREGDRPKAFYHLVAGQIKRVVCTSEGDEKVLEILSPGDSFGEAELFGMRPCTSCAETVQKAVILQIGKEAVHRLILQDPQFALRMLGTLSERQSSLERDAAARQLQSCTTRVMDYLLDLAGAELSTTGPTTLELGASKQLIAARLDLSPETMSRTLRALSDAGLISVRGKRVTLHRPVTSRRTSETIAGRASLGQRSQAAMLQ